MGDADLTRRGHEAYQNEEVSDVLDALDEDLSNLHAAVHDLEQRTIQTLSVQMKGYADFRRFLLAINFVVLPVLVALGLCYSMKEMIDSEGSQAILHTVIMLLLYVTAAFGVPLYLGTLYAIYRFSGSEEMTDEDFMRSLMIGVEDVGTAMQSSEEPESQSEESACNEPITDLIDIQCTFQEIKEVESESESNSQSNTPAIGKSLSTGFLNTNEMEVVQDNKDIGTGGPLSTKVNAEINVPETDIRRKELLILLNTMDNIAEARDDVAVKTS